MTTLHFSTPYLSVKPFEPIDLPTFTLITGLNGCGKTHFLEAIARGNIAVAGITNRDNDIRSFTWASFVPQAEGLFEGHALQSEHQEIRTTFENSFTQAQHVLINALHNSGLVRDFHTNPRALLHLTLDDLRLNLNNDAKASTAYNAIQEAANAISAQIKANLRSYPFALIQLERFATENGISIAAVNFDNFRKAHPASWGRVDMFQQSFSRLFVAYRDLALENKVQVVAKLHGEPDANPLSEAEFIEKYNVPPWDFINRTLEAANLPFSINSPKPYEHSAFQAKLKKKNTNVDIDFQNLSSGEKILMSFANCLYYANDKRQIASFPKLLLLDEVDAPLHPSMSRTMIKIITETLVGEFGVSVIATTHSPSTLASAPEGAIYTMTAEAAGLHKATKGKALNLLTSGVPTLAINFSGRRQVFVESEVDCRIYDGLYGLLKDRLNSERSLSFMCAGTRGDKGDVGNGSSQVKRMVSLLGEAENHSVFGLLDWDNANVSAGRILVLGEGVRNGIENCLFDPLLLACLICRDAREYMEKIGLQRGSGLTHLIELPPTRLQEIAESVEDLILGTTKEAEIIETRYVGEFSLRLRKDYLWYDDHALEARIFEAVPPLRKYKQRAGMLMLHVVENILPDFLLYLPREPLEALQKLLEAE